MNVESTRGAARWSDGDAFRILFVVDGLSFNGAVLMATDLAAKVHRFGATAELFAAFPVEPDRAVTVDPSVAVTHGTTGRVRFRWMLPLVLARLVRACRRADVVVAVSEVGPGLLLGYAGARIARRPYAVMVHADLSRAVEQWVAPRLRRATCAVHRRADTAICVAEDFVPAVVANGVDPARVHVVPGGVDVRRIRELGARPAEVPPPRTPHIAALGRLSVEKGFDLLLRAHASVVESGRRHDLVLIGEGPELEPLRRLADELGVGKSVSLPGLVANPFPTVAGAAAFVLPSRREGLPLALLEAFALGVPVIASRCSRAVEDALGNGERGELVAVDSVADLASALGRHLDDPEPLRARATVGAQHAERHDLERTVGRLLDVLAPLARSSPPARLASARGATND